MILHVPLILGVLILRLIPTWALSTASPFTQVISDVDDTLKSSGGLNIGGIALGGIDVQYERGDLYPGVAEFMFHCSQGSPSPPKLAILSARAQEFEALLEIKDDSPLALKLAAVGKQEGAEGWGIGPVLYGSVAEWICQERKGLRKFENFEKLIAQDPSREQLRYIFVGDTGEYDQQAGESILEKYPELVEAVFLHCVFAEPVASTHPLPPSNFINERPVVFFRTYVGAAVAALKLDLMAPEGLQAVVRAAESQLSNVPKSSSKWKDLEQDMSEALVLLEKAALKVR